jgi:preprotein translocase subunit YajC
MFRSGVVTLFLCAVNAVAQDGGGGAQGPGGIGSILPMLVIMFVIIYFLMIRPEQKKQKKRQQMIAGIHKGDKVLTIGGVYGSVVGVKEDKLSVKIAENTTVDLRKGAVSEVITKKGDTEAEGSQKKLDTDNKKS